MPYRTCFAAIVLVSLVLGACGGSDTTTGAESTGTTVPVVENAEAASVFISHLQEELNHLGYHAGHVDGVWGAATSEALAAFQADHGLEETRH